MASIGEVTLKFGAEGADGEDPLRFKVCHINILVGPNNSGKSLMLRELSGVEPRSNSRSRYSRSSYQESKIVAAVGWDAEHDRKIKEALLSEILSDPSCECKGIPVQDWAGLSLTLGRSVSTLNEIRERLCSDLIEMARTLPSSEVSKFINLSPGLNWQKNSSALIFGAVLWLINRRASDPIDIPTGISTDINEGAEITAGPQSQTNPNGPSSADRVQDKLCAAWAECCEVFQKLGVDVEGLDLVDLLSPTFFGALIAQTIRDNDYLKALIPAEVTGLDQPPLSPERLARFERIRHLYSWALNPAPLTRLRALMDSRYERCTWQNHERRGEIARRVLYLDGLARLEMTRSATLKGYTGADDDEPPILTLLKSADRRLTLRKLVEDAMGAHLVVDMTTQAPQVQWRLSQEEPPEGLENTFSADAAEFQKRAEPLETRSDGIHAFVGMLAAVMAKGTELVFIDEPEAFLHPPLVRKLARQLSELARKEDWQFFIATHSADLLASCAAVGAEVNIVRLTHHKDRSTARLLNSEALRELSRDPLLRSESTLSALFYEGAIVCEAAADRVLYQEVNERLIQFGQPQDGLESCVFLNAQNWQTVARMIAPLRRMGVAAAAVLDADVLFGEELSNILTAAQVPKELRQSWLNLRAQLRESLAKTSQSPHPTPDQPRSIKLKGETIDRLSKTERTLLQNLLRNMSEYGVFLVPIGELEDWFAELGLKRSGDKSKWLRRALNRLGVDPESDTYVRPSQGGIWDFMRDVVGWIVNPKRAGTEP